MEKFECPRISYVYPGMIPKLKGSKRLPLTKIIMRKGMILRAKSVLKNTIRSMDISISSRKLKLKINNIYKQII